MKTTIITVLIIVVVALGYFLVITKTPIAIDPPETVKTATTTETSNAKLNINVVCESALTYMTFPDGASSEKFVAECKEGKHPEVIEHYKAQMNLGDGATI